MNFQIETARTRTETAADLAAVRFAGHLTEYTDAVYTDAGRGHVFAVCGLSRPLPAAGFLLALPELQGRVRVLNMERPNLALVLRDGEPPLKWAARLVELYSEC